ncbi:hypothetical protein BK140_32695, partial [Paenibacillus macerans]
VKPSSADGTWTEGSWESRTPPSMKKSTADNSAVFFAFSECCSAMRWIERCTADTGGWSLTIVTCGVIFSLIAIRTVLIFAIFRRNFQL